MGATPQNPEGVPTLVTGTIGYSRKANLDVRNGVPYESTEVSVYMPFEFVADDEKATERNAVNAFTTAQIVALTKLGIPFDYDPEMDTVTEHPLDEVQAARIKGAVQKVQKAFPGAKEQVPSDSRDDEAECPECGGPMYDNRQNKRNPRQPDFRCKAYKEGCEGVIWPPPKGRR